MGNESDGVNAAAEQQQLEAHHRWDAVREKNAPEIDGEDTEAVAVDVKLRREFNRESAQSVSQSQLGRYVSPDPVARAISSMPPRRYAEAPPVTRCPSCRIIDLGVGLHRGGCKRDG